MKYWVQVALLAASLLPLSVSANPFSSLPLRPTGEITATGKTIFTLKNGDYTHPRFSPDSRYLAFSAEVSAGSTALTEIQVLDLKTLHVQTLLDAKASRDFAIYNSLITGYFWINSTTLQATISDGDVSGADLIYDVTSGKLLEKKPLSQTAAGSDEEGKIIDGIAAAFPSVPYAVMANSLANGFKVGDMKYVVQKNYFNQDNHVWYLDIALKKMTKLVDIPSDWIYSLRGAFAYGQDFVLLVAYNQEAYLVRYHETKLALLARFAVKNYQQTALRVEYTQGDRVLFEVITGPSYEKQENYLFVYRQEGLKKIKDENSFDDLNIDPTGKLVCFSQWLGDKRELVLKELKDFR
ncbi:MAG: hypothetical protein ACYC9J_01065 [Sulfuricaulis sp.]